MHQAKKFQTEGVEPRTYSRCKLTRESHSVKRSTPNITKQSNAKIHGYYTHTPALPQLLS